MYGSGLIISAAIVNLTMLAYKKLVIRCTPAGQRLIGTVLFGDIADGLCYLDLIRSEEPIDPMRTDLIFGRDFVVAAARELRHMYQSLSRGEHPRHCRGTMPAPRT